MSKIKIGIVGVLQSGKSLLVNCLLHRSVATVGDGTATTHAPVYYSFSSEEYAEIKTEDGFVEIPIEEVGHYNINRKIDHIQVYLNCLLLKHVTLVDLPGSDFDNNDNKATLRALSGLDCAILVATNVKELSGESIFYTAIFNQLKKEEIPYYAFMNCTHQHKWSPDNRKNRYLAKADYELLSIYPPLDYDIEDEALNVINVMWYWCSIADNNDSLKLLYSDDLCGISNEELHKQSNFNLIESIFSTSNLKMLQIRKDFRRQVLSLQNKVCPIGTIQAFAFNSIPDGWLPCDGSSVSKETFFQLYKVIGDTFGHYSSDVFNLPDLRGRFIRGWDESGIYDENRPFGSFQEDAFQKHQHTFDKSKLTVSINGSHCHSLYCNDYETVTSVSFVSSKSNKRMCYPTNTYSSGLTNLCPSAGSHNHEITLSDQPVSSAMTSNKMRTTFETRPKNVALTYCIKALDQMGLSYTRVLSIPLNSMKYCGNGVYEMFVRLNKAFMITSDRIPLRYPIMVEFHNDNSQEIVIQKIDRFDPIKISEEGVYFIRLVIFGNLDKPINEYLLEVFKIDAIGIIGNFNDWQSSINLELQPNSLIYGGDLELPNGIYEFKYRANNDWSLELAGEDRNLSSRLGNNLTINTDGRKLRIKLDLGNHPWRSSFTYID